MAHLRFRLERPNLMFEMDGESEKWDFRLVGKCEKQDFWHRFVIREGEKQYDGFAAVVSVHIRKRPPISEVARIPVDKPWDAAEEHRDLIHVTCPESGDATCYIQVGISLPPDAYQRIIDVDWTKQVVVLRVSSALMDEVLQYGSAPDGTEVEFVVDKRQYTFLEEVTLHFLSKVWSDQDDAEDADEDCDAKESVETAPTPQELILASMSNATKAIKELRASVIKAAWLLAAVVAIAAFIR